MLSRLDASAVKSLYNKHLEIKQTYIHMYVQEQHIIPLEQKVTVFSFLFTTIQYGIYRYVVVQSYNYGKQFIFIDS